MMLGKKWERKGRQEERIIGNKRMGGIEKLRVGGGLRKAVGKAM